MDRCRIGAFVVLVVLTQRGCYGQVSALDRFIGPFRIFKSVFHTSILSNVETKSHELELRQRNKLQPKISSSIPFPCSIKNTRSNEVPLSVHKLRPGDIDVVAAIGDSLTAGLGLLAGNVIEVLGEYRGAAFSMGGEFTWRKYLTLPNILKQFNPKLMGYSLRNSITISKDSQFNVAEAGAVSKNTPYMAKMLALRILKDPRVDIHRHWKLISFMIGPNDFCTEICYFRNTDVAIAKHKRDLIQVLTVLKQHLPKTIVNVIPPVDVFALKEIGRKPEYCAVTHSFECPCVFGLVHESKQKLIKEVISKWQDTDKEIAAYPEFHTDDFTVVVQPFAQRTKLPRCEDKDFDLSYLSDDCFHFSQKGNAAFAQAYWNNLMQPVGNKSLNLDYEFFKNFQCPTEENPYIFTNQNSINV